MKKDDLAFRLKMIAARQRVQTAKIAKPSPSQLFARRPLEFFAGPASRYVGPFYDDFDYDDPMTFDDWMR